MLREVVRSGWEAFAGLDAAAVEVIVGRWRSSAVGVIRTGSIRFSTGRRITARRSF